MKNTPIPVKILAVPHGEYPEIFYAESEASGLTLASVNAGNSAKLYVGGGGVNGGFASLLSASDTSQSTDQYKSLHLALLKKLGTAEDGFETYPSGDPMAFCYARTARVTAKSGHYDGVCFMDVFAPAHLPHRNPLNAAMLYLAPPDGPNYADEAAFLQAIGSAAENVIATAAGYNAIAAQHQQPAIEALRLCLFSSGIYNSHSTSSHRIARTIYAGLCKALQQGDSGLKEIQLPVPAEPLFSAVEADLL